MRRTLPLEARVSLAVGCTLVATLVAVGVGVVMRTHEQTAATQRTALQRQAELGAAALLAGAPRLPGSDPQIALFLGGRHLGAALSAPSAAARAHAGDPGFLRWRSDGQRVVMERGVRLAGGAGVLEAASAAPGRQARALRRIELEALVPIVLGLLGGAMVVFGRAARRHRTGLVAITEAAGRLGEGDLDVRLNQPGRDELARLAASVDGLAGRLARVEDARQRSIAQISHDLRSPLTVIKAYAHALRRGEQAPARLGRLAVIDEEVDRVVTLVDDLLALGRLRASALLVRPAPVDLSQLVGAVVDRRQAIAAERGVTLRCILPDEPVRCDVDAGRMAQVVTNLIENAMQHANASAVEVCLRQTDESCELLVSDNGRGIAERHLPFLFDAFYHGGAGGRGAGLGLAIARELVAAHGGSIEARNRFEGGACFTVRLPCLTLAASTELVEC